MTALDVDLVLDALSNGKRLTVFVSTGEYGRSLERFDLARNEFDECRNQQVAMGPQVLAPSMRK